MRVPGLALCTLAIALILQAERSAAADSTSAASGTLQPRIVNGRTTFGYPPVGALLIFADPSQTLFTELCSGTLIGCQTFLTAAHCVCSPRADTAQACERDGVTDPATMAVYLQHGGVADVASVAVDPDYNFGVGGDLAILTLQQPVTGIAPSPLNTAAKPAAGTQGTIVGFGETSGGRQSANDDGIKREGQVTTAHCTTGVPDATNVCWQFTGTGANACSGDSGGPLFLDFGSGPLLAGVTSGGDSTTCLAPDMGFDTDIFVARAWIERQAGHDIGVASCGLPAVGTAATTVTELSGEITAGAPDAHLQFLVPSGKTVLRVTLNSQDASGSGPSVGLNDFDLYVAAGRVPTTTNFDCFDGNPTSFSACEFTMPVAGTWHVLVHANQGVGAFQLTATSFASPAPAGCAGDCTGNGHVTIDEIVTGINIVLGNSAVNSCPSFAANGTAAITIDNLVTAVNNGATQCPSM